MKWTVNLDALRPGELAAHSHREPGESWLAPWTVFWMAVWFGLVSGLIELSLLVGRVAVFEKGFFLRSRHFVWMVPVSDLVIYAVVGMVLAVGKRWFSTIVARTAVGALIFLTLMSQLLLVRGLNFLTCLLISSGIALRTAGWLETRLRRSRRLIPVGVVAFAIVLIGLVGVSLAWERSARNPARSVRDLGHSPALNVLLIVLDTVRADHLGLYGYVRDTSPNLVKLADRGVQFARARSTAPWTLPSHASLFTGRWPHELGVEQKGWLDDTFPTLAEFLGARGYRTAGFVANQFFCGHESGLARGYSVYRDYEVNPAEVLRSSTLGWFLMRTALRVRDELSWNFWADSAAGLSVDFSRKDAAMINRDFLDWQSGQAEKPFFAFLNYFDAHDPYLAPSVPDQAPTASLKSRADFIMVRDWQKIDKKSLSPEAIALARDAYDDCIASLDRALGKLFAELGRRGVLDQTLVVLTADHGEQFGENGNFGHGMSLHAPEVHVPLVIFGPSRVPRGTVVMDAISLRDIPATVVDLLGFENESPFPGHSLAHAWQPSPSRNLTAVSPPLSELHASLAETSEPHQSSARNGPIKALVLEKDVYIRHAGGEEELYELESDPGETHDVSDEAGAETVLEQCRSILDRLMAGSPTETAGAAVNRLADDKEGPLPRPGAHADPQVATCPDR